MTVSFWTPGLIPLEAFTIMGANVKVVDNPIGQFGTGLKYAVAVILRHGGKIRMFRDGVEYEFYTYSKDFRGKDVETVRMRKRHGTLSRWLSSQQLPFTLSYGRNWSLWQAYRELESNTRDERGVTHAERFNHPSPDGTTIEIDCPGFLDAVAESEAFLPPDPGALLYSGPMVDIYNRPSKYFYYRGIRVYDLRYPAKLTYDFKYPYVTLTEDRTAGNAWSMIYSLSHLFQAKIENSELLRAALEVEEDDEPTFEAYEFMFDGESEASSHFMGLFDSRGRSQPRAKVLRSFYATYEARIEREPTSAVELPDSDWNLLLGLLRAVSEGKELHEDDMHTAAALYASILKEIE